MLSPREALRELRTGPVRQRLLLGLLSGLAAGFHAVAHLPAATDEQTVIGRARARRIGLYGMSTFRADKATEPPAKPRPRAIMMRMGAKPSIVRPDALRDQTRACDSRVQAQMLANGHNPSQCSAGVLRSRCA